MVTEIYDWNDLAQNIEGVNGSNDPRGHYVLQNDIDSDSPGYSGTGDSWQPPGENATGELSSGFSGTIDGNGHEIRDLVIDDNSHDTSEDNIGFIGDNTVGSSGGDTIIKNLGIHGTIDTTNNSGSLAGLLIGQFQNNADSQDLIDNCYAYGTVNASNMLFVGGLIGRNYGTTKNSYSITSVTGGTFVGGFTGFQSGTLEYSYCVGDVTANSDDGAFAPDGASVNSCYYDSDVASISDSLATGLTTSEMQGSSASSNMGGFDFSTVWNEVIVGVSVGAGYADSDGYPILTSLNEENQVVNVQGISIAPPFRLGDGTKIVDFLEGDGEGIGAIYQGGGTLLWNN